MQFSIVAVLAAAATVVSAFPTEQGGYPQGGDYGDGSMDSYCSNNQKAACCNTEDGSNASGGLVGGVLSGVLSGSCALTVVGGNCRQGAVSCCNVEEQNGLVNVAGVCGLLSL